MRNQKAVFIRVSFHQERASQIAFSYARNGRLDFSLTLFLIPALTEPSY